MTGTQKGYRRITNQRRRGPGAALPIGRKPYVNREVKGYLTRLLGGETRVIHDRVRARAGLASPTPEQSPPSG